MKISAMIIVGALSGAPVFADDGLAGLADPTRPSGASAEPSEPVYSGPALQATMVGPGAKRATISGKSYGVGDRFGKGTIADIRPYEVIVEEGGRQTHLRMVPALAKDVVGTSAGDKKGANQ